VPSRHLRDGRPDGTVAGSDTVVGTSTDRADVVGWLSIERPRSMATIEECERAFRILAEQLAGVDSDTRKKVVLDRSITCQIRDLGVIFAGQLRDGGLHDIRQVENHDGQLRLSVDSDNLLKLTSGELSFLSAWTSGKLRVDASVFDLLKLRSLF
jgi:hypothetical protein